MRTGAASSINILLLQGYILKEKEVTHASFFDLCLSKRKMSGIKTIRTREGAVGGLLGPALEEEATVEY